MRKLVLVLMCVLAAGAQAQPPMGPRNLDPERDRAMLKARLENRLAETRQMQERLEGALQRLDEGAPAAEVRADLEMPGEHRELRRTVGVPPWRETRHRLTDEEREALKKFVHDQAPDLARRVDLLRNENPMLADRMLSRMEPRLRLFMAEEDQHMRELRMREMRASWDVLGATRAFADALRQSESVQRTRELAAELRNALREHFDLRQAMHQREIELLEQRLVQLRQEMEEHLEARDELVERRVEGVIRFVKQHPDAGGGKDQQPP